MSKKLVLSKTTLKNLSVRTGVRTGLPTALEVPKDGEPVNDQPESPPIGVTQGADCTPSNGCTRATRVGSFNSNTGSCLS